MSKANGEVVLIDRRLKALENIRDGLDSSAHSVFEFEVSRIESISGWMRQISSLDLLANFAGFRMAAPYAKHFV